jgi:pilus assembly protein CpaC
VLSDQPTEIAKPVHATVGKSILLRFDEPLRRVSVGNPNVADVTLISRRELYLLGKAIGGTNVMLWGESGRATVVDVSVAMDTAPLAAQLRHMLPHEKEIRVEAAAGSVVLSGTVSSAAIVDQAISLAEAYVRDLNRALVLPVVAGDASVPAGAQVAIRTGTTTGGGVTSAVGTVGARVVNLLRVREGQQVMLEVKVAEVNRNLLDKLGVDLNLQTGTGAVVGIISRFFDPTAGGVLGWRNGSDFINFYAQRDDGLVKLLAEPNIVAISGQEASFLAGGTVFLPVPQSGAGGGPATITLQERDFGVSVRFLPTVLGGGRINLRVQPEVSEPLQQGLQITTGGSTSTLPAFAARRAFTTVQLNDGQSLAIAGLIKSNFAQTVNAYPVLGELPVLGPLFRSTNFKNEKTELLFIITPRLVKPLPENFAGPTDRYVEPTRTEALLGGKMEGSAAPQGQSEAAPSPGAAPAPRQGGFEVK